MLHLLKRGEGCAILRPQTNTDMVPGEVVSGGIGSAGSMVGLVILEGLSSLCDSMNLLILMYWS